MDKAKYFQNDLAEHVEIWETVKVFFFFNIFYHFENTRLTFLKNIKFDPYFR